MRKTGFSVFIIWKLTICFLSSSVYGNVLENVNIHGFISQGYMKATNDKEYMVYGTKDGTFEFNELGVNFSAKPVSSLRIGAQLISYDLGHLGNDEIVFDWAYGDFTFRNYLGVRAGLIKIPHGFYNTERDVDLLRTTVFLPQSVYAEYFRDAFARMKGIELYGSLPLGVYYKAAYGVVTVEPEGGLAQTFAHVFGIEPQDTGAKENYVWNIQWHPSKDVFDVFRYRVGLSYYAGKGFVIYGKGDEYSITWPFETVDAWVSSIEITANRLLFSAEYMRGYIGFYTNFSPEIMTMPKVSVHYERYYCSLSYQIFSTLDLAILYSVSYYDGDDKSGRKNFNKAPSELLLQSDAYSKDLCLGVRYDINAHWLIKFETHFINGTLMVVGDPMNDKENWMFYAAKITFSF